MSTVAPSPLPTGTWTIDPAHSRVGFSVKHMGIATVRGHFTDFEGSLAVGDDPADVRVDAVVRAASIDTQEPDRDAHLRSADFLDADEHPEIRFVARRVEVVDEDELALTGDLTIRGVTNEVTLGLEVQGTDTDPWGNERVGLEARGQISRADWGMRFNQALGSGNMLVGDRVKIALDVSAVRA